MWLVVMGVLAEVVLFLIFLGWVRCFYKNLTMVSKSAWLGGFIYLGILDKID